MKSGILIVAILFSFLTCSQPSLESGGLTLENCIEIALKKNDQINLQATLVQIEKKNVKLAVSDLFPQMNFQTNYNFNTGRVVNPFSNEIEENPIQIQRTSLGLSIPVSNALATSYRIKIAKKSEEIQSLLRKDTERDIAIRVIQSYLSILMETEKEKIYQSRLISLSERLRVAKDLYALRRIKEQSLLELEVSMLEAESSLNLVKRLKKDARHSLFELLGIKNQIFTSLAPVDFEGELLYDHSKISTERFLGKALAGSYELQVIDLQGQQERYAYESSRLGRFPVVSLSAFLNTSYSTQAPDFIPDRTRPGNFVENNYINQLDFNLTRVRSFDISWNLFNGFKSRREKQRYRLVQESIRNKLRIESQRFKNEVTQFRNAAIEHYEAWVLAEKLELATRKIYENALVNRDAGKITTSEYMLALNRYEEARIKTLQEKYQCIAARKILLQYLQ